MEKKCDVMQASKFKLANELVQNSKSETQEDKENGPPQDKCGRGQRTKVMAPRKTGAGGGGLKRKTSMAKPDKNITMNREIIEIRKTNWMYQWIDQKEIDVHHNT